MTEMYFSGGEGEVSRRSSCVVLDLFSTESLDSPERVGVSQGSGLLSLALVYEEVSCEVARAPSSWSVGQFGGTAESILASP